MKAVRVQKIGLEHPMRVEEVPDPVPEAGELRVRVEAAGVNPHEIAVRDGNHPIARAKDYPYICGMDLAGTVEAVGPGVPAEGPGGFAPGDRVWGRSSKGAYAERAVLAAATSGRLPDRYSFNEGACLPVPSSPPGAPSSSWRRPGRGRPSSSRGVPAGWARWRSSSPSGWAAGCSPR